MTPFTISTSLVRSVSDARRKKVSRRAGESGKLSVAVRQRNAGKAHTEVIAMVRRGLFLVSTCLLAVMPVGAQLPEPRDTVTLYSPWGSKGEGAEASISFLLGVTGEANRTYPHDFDLVYGSLRVGNDWDWFD